jgi:predicted esterase
MKYVLLLAVGAAIVALVACSSDSKVADTSGNPSAGTDGGSGGGGGGGNPAGGNGNTDGGGGGNGNTDSGGGSTGLTHPPSTPPSKMCTYTPDSDGFFKLTSPMGDYWVRLPKGYDSGKPTPVVIGMHGCGDTAQNFVTWGAAPYNDTTMARQNDGQLYIGIAVEDVPSNCWDGKDSGKVLAALDDAAACFYVDQSKVTIAGYSSGAAVAYLVGLSHAERFNGILIEDGALYDNGMLESTLLSSAAWKINIAHIAHDNDGDYPLAQVQADWAKIMAAGFPLQTTVVAGTHDGTSTDWYSYLIPKTTAWTAP